MSPWSQALLDFRRAYGLSVTEAAQQLLQGHPHMASDLDSLVRSWYRWEQGRKPASRSAEPLANMLGVSVTTLLTGRPSVMDLSHGSVSSLSTGELWEGDEEMRRRNFLAALSALAASVGLDAVLPVRGSAAVRRVGMADVDQVSGIVDLYRAADYRHGGGECLAEASTFVERASSLLHQSYTDAVGLRLHGAVANARQLVGWMALDMGNVAEARRHWLAADSSARAANDFPLQARIRYCYAQEARARGDHEAMRRHMLDGLQLAELGRATATVMAMLDAFGAMAAAGTGRDDEALSMLAKAEDWYGRSAPASDPAWVRFFDDAEMSSAQAHVHREVARRRESFRVRALEGVTAAVESYGPEQARSRALVTATAAGTAFIAREPERGVELARDAVAQAGRLRSRRVYDRLARLAGELGPFVRRGDVRELARDLSVATA